MNFEKFMKYVFLISKRELVLGLHGFHVYLLWLNLIWVFNYQKFFGGLNFIAFY